MKKLKYKFNVLDPPHGDDDHHGDDGDGLPEAVVPDKIGFSDESLHSVVAYKDDLLYTTPLNFIMGQPRPLLAHSLSFV